GYFVVVNKDNYPAETRQINDLITKCLDIQTSQFVTETKENHEALEVTEKDARHVVKFLKPDGSLLTGVIIGKNKETGQGSYVRLATSDKVYVAPQVPWISTGPMSYIDQKLVVTSRNNIQSVTVVSPDSKYTLKVEKEGEGIVLENIPAAKKLKDSDGRSVFNALTDIRFTDVKKKSAETDELTFERQYICRLKDSTVYTFNIARKDDKTYVTCRAEFTDTMPVTIKKEGESEEELKKKEAKLLARDKAKEFTTRHQGWVYQIADWKAKNLTKKLSDLLEDVITPEEKTEQKPEETEQQKKEPEETQQPAEPNAVEAEP
ncbi:MAG: DUF4340 domain-containing protein, partial [Sedimentisphaerales bacterium]